MIIFGNNLLMRKSSLSVADAKNYIDELVGKNITMQVCRGRKQVKKYKGIVENTFRSVFVVKLTEGDTHSPTLTYSYSDVVCEEVRIFEA